MAVEVEALPRRAVAALLVALAGVLLITAAGFAEATRAAAFTIDFAEIHRLGPFVLFPFWAVGTVGLLTGPSLLVPGLEHFGALALAASHLGVSGLVAGLLPFTADVDPAVKVEVLVVRLAFLSCVALAVDTAASDARRARGAEGHVAADAFVPVTGAQVRPVVAGVARRAGNRFVVWAVG